MPEPELALEVPPTPPPNNLFALGDPRDRWCFHRGGPKMNCDDQGCPWSVFYWKTRYKQAKLALKAAENVFNANDIPAIDKEPFSALVAELYLPIPKPGDPKAAKMNSPEEKT